MSDEAKPDSRDDTLVTDEPDSREGADSDEPGAPDSSGAPESSGAEGSETDVGASTDATGAGAADVQDGDDSPMGPEAAASELERELEALRDQHLRLAADFDNYRRRAETEMRKSWMRAQADLVRNFLDALDDLQRVTDVEPEATTVESLIEGVDLVERKLFQAMAEAGAEVVDPVGEDFDPNTMEAVMRVPTEEEGEDDTVDQVFQKGYTFKGHLVRPARVSVRKHE